MNNPKISVIIPTYNRANLIGNTILGVINQTLTDWELLIIDDGSTDNSKEIISEFTKKDKRIKYLPQDKNSGCPSVPRNIGIDNASGEYVAFLDSDDEWLPTKLEKQLALFENSNNPKLGVVACYLNIKNTRTKKISKYDRYFKGKVLGELLENNFIFTASCVMTKLSVLKEAGPFDPLFKVSEDSDMWLRIAELGYEFDYVPEYLLNYIVHDSNIYFENKLWDGEQELITLITKHKNSHFQYKSTLLGLYYIDKNKWLSIKYLSQRIFKKNITLKEKMKVLGYMIVMILPFIKKVSKKLWKKVRNYI